MKLANPITITPPPITNEAGVLMTPPPIEFTTLDVTYMDNPKSKTVYARINMIPQPMLLVNATEYDSLGDYTQQFLEDRLTTLLGNNPAQTLRNLFPKTLEENPNGPGSILSGMLSSLGIQATPNCSCRRNAIAMNENGPEWCEQNMDTILGWMKTEATKRSLPFVDPVARMMVNRAISKSKRLTIQAQAKAQKQ
jgi:hypothetical protein